VFGLITEKWIWWIWCQCKCYY